MTKAEFRTEPTYGARGDRVNLDAVKVRFWDKVDRDSGDCWEWTGCLSYEGLRQV